MSLCLVSNYPISYQNLRLLKLLLTKKVYGRPYDFCFCKISLEGLLFLDDF
jgi:hypothetical protein